MSALVERRQYVEQCLNTGWIWGGAFLIFFAVLVALKPPENWHYVLAGVAFLVITVPVALVHLRYGARWLEFGLLAALILQTWISQELFPPVSATDFGLQLCLSASGMYFFIYGLRRPLITWLERSGAI